MESKNWNHHERARDLINVTLFWYIFALILNSDIDILRWCYVFVCLEMYSIVFSCVGYSVVFRDSVVLAIQLFIQMVLYWTLNLLLSLFSNNKLDLLNSLIWTFRIQKSCFNALILFTNLERIKFDLRSTSSLFVHPKKL